MNQPDLLQIVKTLKKTKCFGTTFEIGEIFVDILSRIGTRTKNHPGHADYNFR